MSPERWKKLGEIYNAALPMGQSERRDFLKQACKGDEELRREAQSLLEADDADNSLLQTSAFALGMKVMAQEETRRKMMDQETEARFESASLIGKKLNNRYKILEALDAGGMGEVYKAQDLKLKRPVVVKVLKKKWQNNPRILRKFQDEERASQISHPGVVTVFDKNKLPGGQQYLVMEFIKGSTLGQAIKDHRDNHQQMAFSEVAEIMKQAGRAVAAIHQERLVHRDLKPDNIMLQDTDTDEIMVKIIDFGIVRVLGTHTELGQTIGTIPYMSHEQLNGQDVTPASDVFALGVIAYEMLTGCRPFNELQRNELKVKPSALRPDLPKGAEQVILKALEYEAVKRQQSAREFGEALAAALDDTTQPLPSKPPEPDSLSEIRRRVLSANSEWELREVLYDVEGFLSKDPFNGEARILKDQIMRALATWSAIQLTPVLPRFNKKWLIASVVLIALIAGVIWWSQSSQAVRWTEVAGARIESSPATTVTPTNEKIYDAEYSFPTGKPPDGMVYATVGFTVWRTRPATTRDGEDTARETIDSQEMASERIENYVSDGERIYLGIESLTGEFMPDRGGYLYVINREQYADGTFGRARLIFPTLLTYEGRNRVRPGQPIVLPEKSRPFIVKRSSANQVAETYTIILSPWEFQLPDALGNKAMELSDNVVADWEKKYGGRMYRATLRGGVGQTRTNREQAIGSRATIDTAEALTRDDPLPQTCYRGAVKIGNPVMVTVALRFKE